MPSAVKRLTVLRDRKVQEIDKNYWKDLNKLQERYAKNGNTRDALYIEKMQVAYLDEQKKLQESDRTQIVLTYKDAKLTGAIGYDHDNECTVSWYRKSDTITFEIPELAKGKYKVTTEYGSIGTNKLLININEKIYEKSFNSTSGWNEPKDVDVGYYEHEGGAISVKLNLAKDRPGLNLYSITFLPK